MLLTTTLLILFSTVSEAQNDTNPPELAPLPVIPITISTHRTYQTISGFGLSKAFTRASTIHRLPNTTQTAILDLLFDDAIGAGLTILRNGIGSSNSTEKDHMLSIEPISPGTPSSPPIYILDSNDSSQIWLSQVVSTRYNVRTFYASAWSAPWYMKDNLNDLDGGYLCGVSRTNSSSGDWRQNFANYLVQYLRQYLEVGINLIHLGFLNEPDISPSYAGMRSNGSQAVDFLKVLLPTLSNSEFRDVKLVCCDNTGWHVSRATLAELQNVGGEKYLDVYSSHGYSSPLSSRFNTSLPVWQTGWADLTTPITAVWDSATRDLDSGDATDGLKQMVWDGQ